MTRIEKSDAQLDAEVTARMDVLAATIALHRGLRRDDLRIEQLASYQPPTARDPGTGVVHQHEASALGMNMSARLYRFVESAPITEFPWHGAFRMLRTHCRRYHSYHTGPDVPFWRGSLCQEFVRLVVIGPERSRDVPLSVHDASIILRYDDPEPVLRYAFGYIEDEIDNTRARAEQRAREDAGQGPGALAAVMMAETDADAAWRIERRRYFERVRSAGVKVGRRGHTAA